jgi:hypothetical protein
MPSTVLPAKHAQLLEYLPTMPDNAAASQAALAAAHAAACLAKPLLLILHFCHVHLSVLQWKALDEINAGTCDGMTYGE